MIDGKQVVLVPQISRLGRRLKHMDADRAAQAIYRAKHTNTHRRSLQNKQTKD